MGATAQTGQSAEGSAAALDADRLAVLEAVASDIIPEDDGVPGARQAGVPEFIATELAGAENRWLDLYLAALQGIDRYCVRTYSARYAECAEDERSAVLTQLESGTLGDVSEEWAKSFFGVIWGHTVQGYLCDPEYGGNRDLAGWRAVGFPGAQHGYTAAQQTYGKSAADITPLVLADMAEMHRNEPGRFFTGY
ncbi:gluconate 2-dehydrogenase subunit 3 family protein [Amycolatopsis sp. Poz14]|uniref:gluconate 2-dehydrogenase subunit 3 family protein n=1 Tax=Amycolatopsis sp. Poz14 TaxID=1447705 RepID=UPI001EE802C0|nr:gluconate 2-dehydrogenase subunit 3 family protein [Amycolatopsis sp. Poz14]MCG3753964.1 gluconate 2-dehydrogenase subunit 3 family protein [Amycolatopsis sp. Poz14]